MGSCLAPHTGRVGIRTIAQGWHRVGGSMHFMPGAQGRVRHTGRIGVSTTAGAGTRALWLGTPRHATSRPTRHHAQASQAFDLACTPVGIPVLALAFSLWACQCPRPHNWSGLYRRVCVGQGACWFWKCREGGLGPCTHVYERPRACRYRWVFTRGCQQLGPPWDWAIVTHSS